MKFTIWTETGWNFWCKLKDVQSKNREMHLNLNNMKMNQVMATFNFVSKNWIQLNISNLPNDICFP